MEEKDIAIVTEMYIELYEYFNQLGYLFKLNTAQIGDYIRLQLNARLSRVILLKQNDETIGFICVNAPFLNKKLIINGVKNIGIISELFISVEYRGNGYAKLLLNAAEHFLKEMDVNYVQVDVVINNVDAAALYKKHGFSPSSTNFIKSLN